MFTRRSPLTSLIFLIGVIAAAQDSPGAFDYVDIRKGGLGEFIDGKLQRITGGVEIALRAADADAKPMVLVAQEIKFLWGDSTGKPSAIQLIGGVSVDGPQGLITSNRADLDFVSNKLQFSGNVHGKSDSIESFDAERINYDTKSGDSEMTNLHATGIKMGDSPADAKGGAGFSSMSVDRAGLVVTSDGQVKKMTGGVSISLAPKDPKAKTLKLNASDATFAWSGSGGQPTGIALRGNVRVDGPQGAIKSERGDFDLAKKQMTFGGNVSGSLPQLERFDTDKLVYNIESGETSMTNLRAKGLALGPAPAPDANAEAAKNYSTMDIETAPEVSLTGQKLNWMRGGVSLSMKASDPNQPPLTVKAQQMTFGYANEGSINPDRIVLKGDIEMNSPQAFIKSDQAVLNLATNILVFTGNVTGSSPNAKDFAWTEFSYNMKSGEMSGKGFKAKRLEPSAKEPDKQAQPSGPESKQ